MHYININESSKPEKVVIKVLKNLENKHDCITSTLNDNGAVTLYINKEPVVLAEDIKFADTFLGKGHFLEEEFRDEEYFQNPNSFVTKVDTFVNPQEVYMLTSEGASYLLSVGFNIHFC